MPTTRSPRKGSLQFWPRKRAASIVPRIRTFSTIKDAKLVGFAGYKVGMIQAMFVESRKNMPSKGHEVVMPVTIVECPPLRVYGLRFYKKDANGNLYPSKDIVSDNIDKILKRRTTVPKSSKHKSLLSSVNPSEYSDVKAIVYTQPKLTTTSKKKPELFEVGIGGSVKDKIEYAKNILGKEIYVSDIFKDNQLVDIHGVTKGKGMQGPVKRFGLALRSHKSEKTKRGPGSLGAWGQHGKNMWAVAQAGQMGFHLRTEYNKLLLKIMKSSEAKDFNPKSGLHKYGILKNDFILLKGSIMGAKKRLIKFIVSTRPNDKLLLPPNTNVTVLKNF